MAASRFLERIAPCRSASVDHCRRAPVEVTRSPHNRHNRTRASPAACQGFAAPGDGSAATNSPLPFGERLHDWPFATTPAGYDASSTMASPAVSRWIRSPSLLLMPHDAEKQSARGGATGEDLFVTGQRNVFGPRGLDVVAASGVTDEHAFVRKPSRQVRNERWLLSAGGGVGVWQELRVDAVKDLLPPDSVEGHDDHRVGGGRARPLMRRSGRRRARALGCSHARARGQPGLDMAALKPRGGRQEKAATPRVRGHASTPRNRIRHTETMEVSRDRLATKAEHSGATRAMLRACARTCARRS